MKTIESGVCHCGMSMDQHAAGGSCTSPKDMLITLGDAEWAAYARGFESAKSAAMKIVDEEAARCVTGSMAMGVRYAGHKIKQIEPQVTR